MKFLNLEIAECLVAVSMVRTRIKLWSCVVTVKPLSERAKSHVDELRHRLDMRFDDAEFAFGTAMAFAKTYIEIGPTLREQ